MIDDTAMAEMTAKEERLKGLIASYGSVAVAYSGGLDSTYLADVTHEVLGARAWVVLADSPSIPRSELAGAGDWARQRGWNFHIIETDEFQNEQYLKNDANRCYFCKQELFVKMQAFADANGIAVLAYGAIADDLADLTRVGPRAAHEKGVAAPLQEVGLTKAELRVLSAQRRLPTADKASFACLASRIPTGTPVTAEALAMVERAEEVLKQMGFRQYRARHHASAPGTSNGDALCRIEIDPDDFAKLLEPDVRRNLARRIRAIGYRFVTLDLAGYRTGSTAATPVKPDNS